METISGQTACHLFWQSAIFLAPGTGFVKDNFSTDGGGGGDGEWQMKLLSLSHLLHGPVHGLAWGPCLFY